VIATKDEINEFLSRPHPRLLPGPWSTGWALDFHSRYSGADWVRSATGDLAYRLKYQSDVTALIPLVDQSLALLATYPELGQVDAILPVPPSTPRQENPVSAFAKALGERLKIEVLPVLVKTRPTKPQKEMHTRAQKLSNVAGAFSVMGSVRGKQLLVVDDLFDSGATLGEITCLLLREGAAKVSVLTLTRTIHSDA
jgi:predicted amidophosphoribosyltransferase